MASHANTCSALVQKRVPNWENSDSFLRQPFAPFFDQQVYGFVICCPCFIHKAILHWEQKFVQRTVLFDVYLFPRSANPISKAVGEAVKLSSSTYGDGSNLGQKWNVFDGNWLKSFGIWMDCSPRFLALGFFMAKTICPTENPWRSNHQVTAVLIHSEFPFGEIMYHHLGMSYPAAGKPLCQYVVRIS